MHLDGRKIELLENLFSSDCVINRPEGTVKGLPGIRGVVERNIVAYSKFETEVHDIFESGDRVVVRFTHRARGTGVFRSRIGDYDLKGKAISWGAIAIFRMENGKIAEQWVNRDELGILLSAGFSNQTAPLAERVTKRIHRAAAPLAKRFRSPAFRRNPDSVVLEVIRNSATYEFSQFEIPPEGGTTKPFSAP